MMLSLLFCSVLCFELIDFGRYIAMQSGKLGMEAVVIERLSSTRFFFRFSFPSVFV